MIHLFCALACEAKPLINHFALEMDQTKRLFKIYYSDKHNMSLTITGVGHRNAAAAVSYHAGCSNPFASDIWLNIGIAGHASADLGSCYLANKISDVNRTHTWYPQFVVAMPCQSLPLMTLDTPSKQYEECLFDMEASGFYEMATRLGTNELIHCIKIVSDNDQQHFSNINAEQVSQYITNNIPVIEKVIEALLPRSEELTKLAAMPNAYNTITEQIHFTVSEQVQLNRLLRQWQLRLPAVNPIDQIQFDMPAKNVLQVLSNKIKASPYSLII